MTKRNKTIYWISTLWLASGMLATGTLQLFRARAEGALAPPGVYGITHLGYPIYFLTILGVWKILGVVAVLIPKFPVLKEWAYAGFFFAMTGAAFSHIAVGDPVKELVPSLLLLVLTVVSWYFSPAGRKIGPLRARINGRIRTEAHRLIAEGDYVVVEARGNNMAKSGLPYNNNYCFVFRLSGNQLKEVTEYFDTELVTAALGQPEGES